MTTTHLAIRALPLVLGLAALSGCGLNVPRLAYLKSPEASQCKDADCPTLEIPAPNHDELYNPAAAAVVHFDGTPVKQPMIMASKGRIWYVMKINPGAHTIKVQPMEGTNLIGAIGSAAKDALKFEAAKGKRYWLFNRIGVGGYSAKTWVEDAAGERPVVAGERNLEPHNIAASLFLGEAEKKAQAAQVEVWWAGAPTHDKAFQNPAVQRVYAEGAGGPAPAAK
jgi:hypothetical protein